MIAHLRLCPTPDRQFVSQNCFFLDLHSHSASTVQTNSGLESMVYFNQSQGVTGGDGRMNDNSHKTVLVVEDQREISDSMNAMLIHKGYRVVNAKDAEGAMKIAEQNRPTLILTDLDLPTLTQLMDRLRAHDGLKHLPVAVIDLDHPEDGRPDINILNSFDELDDLLAAQPQGDGAY